MKHDIFKQLEKLILCREREKNLLLEFFFPNNFRPI